MADSASTAPLAFAGVTGGGVPGEAVRALAARAAAVGLAPPRAITVARPEGEAAGDISVEVSLPRAGDPLVEGTSPDEGLDVLFFLLRKLRRLHAGGFTHNDVQLSSILVHRGQQRRRGKREREDGAVDSVSLVGMGAAAEAGSGQAGAVSSSAPAPEQVLGAGPSEATDVFQAGLAVLEACASGDGLRLLQDTRGRAARAVALCGLPSRAFAARAGLAAAWRRAAAGGAETSPVHEELVSACVPPGSLRAALEAMLRPCPDARCTAAGAMESDAFKATRRSLRVRRAAGDGPAHAAAAVRPER